MLVRVHLLTPPGQASRLPWAGISISNGMLMPTQCKRSQVPSGKRAPPQPPCNTETRSRSRTKTFKNRQAATDVEPRGSVEPRLRARRGEAAQAWGAQFRGQRGMQAGLAHSAHRLAHPLAEPAQLLSVLFCSILKVKKESDSSTRPGSGPGPRINNTRRGMYDEYSTSGG
jgi:hypothetical protein